MFLLCSWISLSYNSATLPYSVLFLNLLIFLVDGILSNFSLSVTKTLVSTLVISSLKSSVLTAFKFDYQHRITESAPPVRKWSLDGENVAAVDAPSWPNKV